MARAVRERLTLWSRAVVLLTAIAATSPAARAVTFNASLLGGGAWLGGAATDSADDVVPTLGANLTVDIGTFVELGIFYEYSFLDYVDGTDGALRFYGAIVRLGLTGPESNLYADSQIGLTHRTGGPFNSDLGLGVGVGLGYRFWLLPYLDLSPRVGVRLLPEPYQGRNQSSNALDFGLQLTFGF